MGRLFPKTVKPFTTTLSREWADEYQREVRRKPVFWHNFFPNDMADWKLYFEPYPRFPKELVARSDGAFVLGGWQTEWWKVNYLTFACNTWNPSRPCTLSDAFRKLWPAEAAALTRCALLLGGHDQPARRSMAGSPPAAPHRGFFNEPPTPENLKRLEEKEQRAAEAETLALGIEQRGRLPRRWRELVVAARRETELPDGAGRRAHARWKRVASAGADVGRNPGADRRGARRRGRARTPRRLRGLAK